MNSAERDRLKQIGKPAFIREEMTRLGFWPPSPDVAEKARDAEAQLRILYRELTRLQTDLTMVEKEIATVGDIPRLLAEIRRARIERVRAQRARRKEENAAAVEARRARDREWRRTLPYLGREVSSGLRFGEESPSHQPEKVADSGLPSLASAADIARAIGIPENELAFLAFHRSAVGTDHYSRFAIPKKKGGVRVISSPKRRLRVAQGWLLVSILEKLPVHDAAMAFRPGRSVVDNAVPHRGKAVVVKTDLKDFFPSITWRRVKRLFQSLGYGEGVSTILSLIATETPRIAVLLDGKRRFAAVGERALPQGACTSPAITNLLCRRMDARLAGAANAFGFTYTRYADDLTFSHEDPEAKVGGLLSLVRAIIADEKFVIKEEKTQILRPQDRQVVTGLVVNGDARPRVSRDDLRRFRAFLHQCETRGHEAMSERIGKDAYAYAAGYLSYLHMTRPEVAARIAYAHPWLNRWQKGTDG
ncbi:MAG: reverse transcriptase domain-containing protein [Capsulimonadales bacterium]|nr:reverse transcriptase domain-containing protein [Capsulimonadales bacterium]